MSVRIGPDRGCAPGGAACAIELAVDELTGRDPPRCHCDFDERRELTRWLYARRHDADDGESAVGTAENDVPDEEGAVRSPPAVVTVEAERCVTVTYASEVAVDDAAGVHLDAVPPIEGVAGPAVRDWCDVRRSFAPVKGARGAMKLDRLRTATHGRQRHR